MVDPDIEALYRLHKVDAVLFEIKSRASSLDLGQAEATAFKAMEASTAPQRERAKQLHTDLKNLELEQQTRQAKIKKFEGQLYDGSLKTAKEVENVQKEVDMLSQHARQADDKIFALMEMVPRETEESMASEKEMAQLRSVSVKKHEAAKAEHAKLQGEFKVAAAQRQPLADKVPAPVLRIYENVRAKTASTAIAFVTPEARCSSCGMHTPEKAIDQLKFGKIMQCEQCRRILILTDS